jgi:mono/diheme cytochrome c family protein
MQSRGTLGRAPSAIVLSLLIPFGISSCESRAPAPQSQNAPSPVQRGAYLVAYGGCNDCHTPKTLTPQGPVPDSTRFLAGYPADAKLPPVTPGALGPGKWGALASGDLTAWAGPWGVSFAANLTPDETGLGGWNEDVFIKTMRTGKHLGVGRELLPPMPWYDVAALTDDDLKAVFAYLRTAKPVKNQVPPPIPPSGGR